MIAQYLRLFEEKVSDKTLLFEPFISFPGLSGDPHPSHFDRQQPQPVQPPPRGRSSDACHAHRPRPPKQPPTAAATTSPPNGTNAEQPEQLDGQQLQLVAVVESGDGVAVDVTVTAQKGPQHSQELRVLQQRLSRDVAQAAHQGHALPEPEHLRDLSAVRQAVR